MRRLIWDIETSPLIALSWKTGYKIDLSYENILVERKIICIAWKWHGKSRVYSLQWDKDQDDRKMLEEFVPILNDADESVMHWGDFFDLPWVKTRALVHGIQTLPKYKTVDTCAWARKHFYLNSAKLDYLAKLLGIGAKLKTEQGLWKRVMIDKDPKAMRFMVKYNCWDVVLLEKVFDRLAQVIPHKTHAGVLNGDEKWTCPHCGGGNVKTSKNVVTAAGTKQFQMKCKDDGRYFTISEKVHDQYLNR